MQNPSKMDQILDDSLTNTNKRVANLYKEINRNFCVYVCLAKIIDNKTSKHIYDSWKGIELAMPPAMQQNNKHSHAHEKTIYEYRMKKQNLKMLQIKTK